MPAPARNELLCLPNGITNLGDIFLRVLRFMGADVVNIEHGAVEDIAVLGYPCGYGSVGLIHEGVGATHHCRGDGDQYRIGIGSNRLGSSNCEEVWNF